MKNLKVFILYYQLTCCVLIQDKWKCVWLDLISRICLSSSTFQFSFLTVLVFSFLISQLEIVVATVSSMCLTRTCMSCRFKLVTFDVTGTLLKFRRTAGEQYVETGKKFGYILNADVVQTNFVKHYKRFDKEYPNFGSGTIGWKNWWKNVVSKCFMESYSGQLSDNDINYFFNDLIQSYSDNTGWKLANGSIELLEMLKSRNVTLGVISNFDARLHNLLKEMKLYDYFKFVITSYESGLLKPDCEIFKLAESFGSTKPSDIKIHIGDNFDLDYKAALDAGWNSILISHSDDSIDNRNDSNLIFSDLNSVRRFLLRSDNLKSQHST